MSKFEEIKDKVSEKLSDLGSHDYSKGDFVDDSSFSDSTDSPRDPNDHVDDDVIIDDVIVEKESYSV